MADLLVGIVDLPELRNRLHVFRNRSHAGHVLADMLSGRCATGAIVLAIPAGGVPVAVEIARRLALPLDVAVVSKITLPWNTEAGYGAVAFDGTVRLNEPLVASVGLGRAEIERGIAATREKVERRVRDLRRERPLPDLSGRTAVIVDDGLASGFTLRTAVEAVRGLSPRAIVVAVPTAHASGAAEIAAAVSALYCPNVRAARRYAVADAYEQWHDVGEEELVRELESLSPPADDARADPA